MIKYLEIPQQPTRLSRDQSSKGGGKGGRKAIVAKAEAAEVGEVAASARDRSFCFVAVAGGSAMSPSLQLPHQRKEQFGVIHTIKWEWARVQFVKAARKEPLGSICTS